MLSHPYKTGSSNALLASSSYTVNTDKARIPQNCGTSLTSHSLGHIRNLWKEERMPRERLVQANLDPLIEAKRDALQTYKYLPSTEISLSLSLSLSVSQSPCRPVDISLQCFCCSVLICHNLSSAIRLAADSPSSHIICPCCSPSTRQTLSLYFPLCHSHNQSYFDIILREGFECSTRICSCDFGLSSLQNADICLCVLQRLVRTTEVEQEGMRPTQTATFQAAPKPRDRKADVGKKKATSKVVWFHLLSGYRESCCVSRNIYLV